MLLTTCRFLLIICTLTCLLSPFRAQAEEHGKRCKADSEKFELHQRRDRITEWFKKYDQIRRDAEMTIGNRLQSLLLMARKPEKKNAELASLMIKKYTKAISELKRLEPTPETRELQDGYIRYFRTARQLFSDYLEAQKKVPFTNQSLKPSKKKLEELDKKNTKLDYKLRKQFIIRKHKHS